jgi:hypothetical protein
MITERLRGMPRSCMTDPVIDHQSIILERVLNRHQTDVDGTRSHSPGLTFSRVNWYSAAGAPQGRLVRLTIMVY